MLLRSSRIRILAVTLSLALAATEAISAEPYPSRVVTMLVPYAPGGSTDTVGRILAESMTQTLGQQVIIENAPGASGTIGAARVARAEPDGYTLLLQSPSHATNTLLYRKLPYAADAFQPIAVLTDTPMTLVGRSDLPPGSISELLNYIRTNKDEVTIGNGGLGAPAYLCGLLLMSKLETKMTAVGYKGMGPAMVDLMGGQIDLACDQATATLGHIRGAKVKAYAVTTASRVPELPELPTLDEAGLKGFETSVWHGLYAPKGTPPEVVEKLAGALRTALQDPKVVKRLADLATKPVALDRVSPEALQATYDAEIAKWQPLIQAAGVYAD
jgi:tripartite-type tricarboxylate transporter receptor subunit TctC